MYAMTSGSTKVTRRVPPTDYSRLNPAWKGARSVSSARRLVPPWLLALNTLLAKRWREKSIPSPSTRLLSRRLGITHDLWLKRCRLPELTLVEMLALCEATRLSPESFVSELRRHYVVSSPHENNGTVVVSTVAAQMFKAYSNVPSQARGPRRSVLAVAANRRRNK